MIRRNKTLTIALDYMKKKLRSNEWVPGNKIDSLKVIAEKKNIPVHAVKRAVWTLESQGILSNRGQDGCWVVGNIG
ncbi:MAG: GntR family transcriptional regulator, partial [bacterium]|nr:GntR family transcriptional regulator [bacterium]